MTTVGTMKLADVMQQGIEQCDVDKIMSCYADNAELRIVDRNHPPSEPLHLRGKEEIGDYYRDVCSRQMQHSIDQEVIGNDRIAFTEACEYNDGTRVLAAELCELSEGKIARQLNVQAWDE